MRTIEAVTKVRLRLRYVILNLVTQYVGLSTRLGDLASILCGSLPRLNATGSGVARPEVFRVVRKDGMFR